MNGARFLREPGRTWLTAALLLAIALPFRLASLGTLSFYADEDLSVLSATAMAAEGVSVLPSGMEYRRAIPLTWLNAASAQVAGEGSELAIRLPSALLGALTVPALFLLGRRWIGFGPSLVASVMLAVSEWHLVFSRQARMYAPLLLFMVLAAWGLWTWTRTGDRKALLGGIAASIVAVFMHKLGIFVVGAALVWLAFPGAVAVALPTLFAVSGGIAVAGFLAGELWIDVPYELLPLPPWQRPGEPVATQSVTPAPSLGALVPILGVVGATLGAYISLRIRPRDESPGALLRSLALVGFAIACGAAAGTGQLYGFALSGAIVLLLARGGIALPWRSARWALLVMAALLVPHFLVWIPEVGVVEALKLGSAVPFPHSFTLVRQTPVAVILFGCTSLWMVLFPIPEERHGLAASALIAIASLAALGMVREAGPTRYLLPAYPFMLLVAGGGVFLLTRTALGRVAALAGPPALSSAALAAAVASIVIFSGVVRGYGLTGALELSRLEHGDPVDEMVHMFPFRPDHRTVGRWVAERRGPGDVVIAEDPLIQVWYAGPIDYWFRRWGDMYQFLRAHPDGRVRDIYAGSEPIRDPGELRAILDDAPGSVWFITSGETVSLPQFYFSAVQQAWRDSLLAAREPAFVGRDGRSAVYCLNCGPASGSSGPVN